MPTVLVVEDDEHILELIKFHLEKESYRVLAAADGEQALVLAQQQRPDLIVLDVMLPGLDGLSVCRRLRQDRATAAIPVIMVSARGEELDKVLGLEIGADDYVTKPFSPRELMARVRARLRNRQENDGKPGQDRLDFGRLVIDQARYQVLLDGQRLELTPKEFDLLRFLAAEPGRVFSRDYLLEKIWGYDYTGDSRTVDVHIRHLRQKMEQVAGDVQFIETVRGVGYRFSERLP
ncbi:MAG: response regulator [Bacillota bacterium]|uniref:response regulator n=1 Tax=Desulfurispora thermophila TaxID=265470 RepID=UPI000361474A|nr:response regulator transcription factor [Desulfurispora thermophila]